MKAYVRLDVELRDTDYELSAVELENKLIEFVEKLKCENNNRARPDETVIDVNYNCEVRSW